MDFIVHGVAKSRTQLSDSFSNQLLLWSDAGSKWQHPGYMSHPQQQEGVRPGACACRGMGSRDVLSKENISLISVRGSLVVQMAKNQPAMWEAWVRPLGWGDPLEEGMATHSSILAWRIPVDRGAWRATVHGVTKSRTRLSD